MSRQWFSALGYLSIFLMPALLLIGAIEDSPWLAFGVVALVFPLARVGDVPLVVATGGGA
jgi:hypothetical protein